MKPTQQSELSPGAWCADHGSIWVLGCSSCKGALEERLAAQKLQRSLKEVWSGEHSVECEIGAYGVCSCAKASTFGCGCFKDSPNPQCTLSWMHK